MRVAAGLKDDGLFLGNAMKILVVPFYKDFKNHVGQQLEPFIGQLCEDQWCLPRSLARCSVPGDEMTSVQFDQILLTAGLTANITSFVPI